MTKVFEDIQELWDYCSFCPICQSNIRKITIQVGPDAVFSLNKFTKQDATLKLQCSYKRKQNIYPVKYTINCNTNHFDAIVDDPQISPISEAHLSRKKVNEAYFYFYIQSSCYECECSTAHSADLELDIVDKKISNIKLEREGFLLLNEVDKFGVTIIHDRNVMLVSHCYKWPDPDYDEESKMITLPLVKLDLQNQARVVDKIKMLILFS